MGQSQNTHSRDISNGLLVYATDQTGVKVCNQGDIVCWKSTLNGSKGGVEQVALPADMSTYAGIATQNSILTSLNDVLYTVMVAFKNVFLLKTVAGDTLKHGDAVYLYDSGGTITDAQTITNTQPSDATVVVGYVVLPQEQIMNGVLSITGGTGTTAPIAIGPVQFPVAGKLLA